MLVILPVLEESQGFVGPDPDKPVHGQWLEWPQGLEDSTHPACHLTGGVDVVRLHVLSEALLEQITNKDKFYEQKNLNLSGISPYTVHGINFAHIK